MATYNINLYQYNNYSERILKKESTLEAYGEPVAQVEAANFNFADSVSTFHDITGITNIPSCNYAIVYSGPDTIISRWFIIESDYISNFKFRVNLRRDVLADYWDNILNSDCFIEKALLPETNKLIFNNENMTVNQIKTSETLLKDNTGVAWLVGYLNRDYLAPTTEEPSPTAETLSFVANNVEDITLDTPISSWAYYNKQNTDICNLRDRDTSFWVKFKFGIANYYYKILYNYTTHIWTYVEDASVTNIHSFVTLKDNASISGFVSYLNTNTIASTMESDFVYDDSTKYNTGAYTYISAHQNQIIKDSGNEYYKIIETSNTTGNYYYTFQKYSSQGSMFSYIWSLISSSTYTGTSTVITDLEIELRPFADTLQFNLNKMPQGQYTITIPISADRLHLKDAPYDMFIMPYGDISIQSTGISAFGALSTNKDLAISMAQGIAEQLGTNLYDLQLLPYCPITGYTISNNVMDIKAETAARYTLIKDSNSVNQAVIVWSLSSHGSFSISQSISSTNKKMENTCDIYRLCSPNYNGQFEFSVAKNNGVSRFDVDYTYLPYKPYIHINPQFNTGSLYGKEYNDARGLICGGDFSISYLSDQWVNYQVNNKNYQNIFDREIQNMETNNRLSLWQQAIGAVTGSVAAGATLGAVTSSGILGVGTGIASLVGGAADIGFTKASQNEALDYKKDMFGYQLGNIQAMPDSLAKVTGFTENNKIFPILEYYTCTDEEKTAFASKIIFNSMTVGIIDKPSNYWNNTWSYDGVQAKGYLKGNIIRLYGYNDDTHLFNEIQQEFSKGVYKQ